MELYRFVKGFTECTDEAEQWLWALKNMGQTVELPEALESPELRALFGAGEIAAFGRDKREQYDAACRYRPIIDKRMLSREAACA